jgi:hypothetical protein
MGIIFEHVQMNLSVLFLTSKFEVNRMPQTLAILAEEKHLENIKPHFL